MQPTGQPALQPHLGLKAPPPLTSGGLRVMALGGHVRWTDLRMSLNGFGERRPESGVVLSNWEI